MASGVWSENVAMPDEGSFISSVKLTQKTYDVRADDNQASRLLETIKQVNERLDLAKTLREEKSALLSSIERKMMDETFASTERAIDSVEELMEYPRGHVSQQESGMEPGTTPFFVLRGSRSLHVALAQLTIASQRLDMVTLVACSKQNLDFAPSNRTSLDSKSALPTYEESNFLTENRARNLLRRASNMAALPQHELPEDRLRSEEPDTFAVQYHQPQNSAPRDSLISSSGDKMAPPDHPVAAQHLGSHTTPSVSYVAYRPGLTSPSMSSLSPRAEAQPFQAPHSPAPSAVNALEEVNRVMKNRFRGDMPSTASQSTDRVLDSPEIPEMSQSDPSVKSVHPPALHDPDSLPRLPPLEFEQAVMVPIIGVESSMIGVVDAEKPSATDTRSLSVPTSETASFISLESSHVAAKPAVVDFLRDLPSFRFVGESEPSFGLPMSRTSYRAYKLGLRRSPATATPTSANVDKKTRSLSEPESSLASAVSERLPPSSIVEKVHRRTISNTPHPSLDQNDSDAATNTMKPRPPKPRKPASLSAATQDLNGAEVRDENIRSREGDHIKSEIANVNTSKPAQTGETIKPSDAASSGPRRPCLDSEFPEVVPTSAAPTPVIAVTSRTGLSKRNSAYAPEVVVMSRETPARYRALRPLSKGPQLSTPVEENVAPAADAKTQPVATATESRRSSEARSVASSDMTPKTSSTPRNERPVISGKLRSQRWREAQYERFEMLPNSQLD